jgi:3-phenylpropionate/cinnamic acid dioxygenase small subunit
MAPLHNDSGTADAAGQPFVATMNVTHPAAADVMERHEITDLITSLFIATDEKDWAGLRACFTDRVLFDMSSLSGSPPAELGADEIVDAWKTALDPIQAIHHQAGNFRVRVAGDEAEAFCYGIAYHYLPNISGKNTRTFVGTYDFHLVRSEDRWRIDRFRFNAKFVDGNLELEKF